MESYQQGETVPEKAYTYNISDVLINVDTIVITIKDPEGTIKIDEAIMVFDSIGTYLYNYDLDTDANIGLWKIIVKVIYNSVISIRNDSFRVVP